MTTGPLANNESRDFTNFIRFDWTDLNTTGFLSTIGAANQRIIGYIPAGGAIETVTVQQVVDPAGASNLTLDVGTTSSDPDEFIDNLDVDAMTQAAYNTGDAFIGTDSGAQTTANVINLVPNNTAAAVPIYMEFNGTLASLTAGEWVIAWKALDPLRFGKPL